MGARPFEASPSRAQVSFRLVKASHPEVKELQDSIVSLVNELNARMLDAYFNGIPIGVPFAFLPDLFPAGYTLGEKFAQCDGRAIVNKASPVHGKNLSTITYDLGSGDTVTWWVRIRD